MVRTAIVTWTDNEQTTVAIRQFRKIDDGVYMVQFPDWEWERVEVVVSIVWA